LVLAVVAALVPEAAMMRAAVETVVVAVVGVVHQAVPMEVTSNRLQSLKEKTTIKKTRYR
jgi:hypothetical protein